MIKWLIIILLILVIIEKLASIGKGLYRYYSIYSSAKRMGLRDKGEVGHYTNSEGKSSYHAHKPCHTRSRIGITHEKEPVKYCWRCEVIFGGTYSPDPDDRESLPTVDQGGTVLDFPIDRIKRAS